jgi:hypothetical protein
MLAASGAVQCRRMAAHETSPDYSLIDRSGAGGYLFFPRPDPVPPPPGATDHEIPAGDGISLGARFYGFDPALPTVLYFHGNGEVASDHDGIAPFYREAGANLLIVEFRGYGRSGGQPTFAALAGDAAPVAEWFHSFLDLEGYKAARFVMGRSMGGNPALEIAANHPAGFRGLIMESGATNLRRLVARLGLPIHEGEGAELVEAHDAKIRRIRLPVLIIHGEGDELIPLDHAAGLYDMLDGTERELVVIPGAGHNDILWVGHRQYFEAIAAFIGRHGGAG